MLDHIGPYRAFMELFRTKSERTYPKASKNIQELGTALVQEWQQYPQRKLRRLVHRMRILDQELYRMRGG
jgi:uncharacterized coiled-coil protein SlyX